MEYTKSGEFDSRVKIVKREEWGAHPIEKLAQRLPALKLPVENVYFTYTDTSQCVDNGQDLPSCPMVVKDLHIKAVSECGMPDIPYNFLLGGDGYVYEGRGWKLKPEEIPDEPDLKDKNTLVIAYIGRQDEKLSRYRQKVFERVEDHIIEYGLRKNYITKDTDAYVGEAYDFDTIIEEREREYKKSTPPGTKLRNPKDYYAGYRDEDDDNEDKYKAIDNKDKEYDDGDEKEDKKDDKDEECDEEDEGEEVDEECEEEEDGEGNEEDEEGEEEEDEEGEEDYEGDEEGDDEEYEEEEGEEGDDEYDEEEDDDEEYEEGDEEYDEEEGEYDEAEEGDEEYDEEEGEGEEGEEYDEEEEEECEEEEDYEDEEEEEGEGKKRKKRRRPEKPIEEMNSSDYDTEYFRDSTDSEIAHIPDSAVNDYIYLPEYDKWEQEQAEYDAKQAELALQEASLNKEPENKNDDDNQIDQNDDEDYLTIEENDEE